MVEFYERVGFLPAGVLNGLLRLGWSLDDKSEIFSLDEAIKLFTLDRVVKAPAGFDPDKMVSYQQHWMTQLPLAEKVAGCLPYLEQAGLVASPANAEQRDFVTRLVAALGDRIRLFSDVLDVAYFFKDEIADDEKEFAKRVAKEGVPALLAGYRDRIAAIPDWTVENLEAALKSYCEEQGQSAGTLIHALRISTTGVPIGLGVYECVLLVGRERVLSRIEQAIQRATHQPLTPNP
jgi:glutamyl-tRNA synthetase